MLVSVPVLKQWFAPVTDTGMLVKRVDILVLF